MKTPKCIIDVTHMIKERPERWWDLRFKEYYHNNKVAWIPVSTRLQNWILSRLSEGKY